MKIKNIQSILFTFFSLQIVAPLIPKEIISKILLDMIFSKYSKTSYEPTTTARGGNYKIVVLGAGGVGKSCMTLRFIANVFQDEYDPTIEDSYRKSFTLDGESIILEILDTAGPEEYSALKEQWIRWGDGFILVYSVTQLYSFSKELPRIINQIKRVRVIEDDELPPILLVGNKIDLEELREITFEEGAKFAENHGINSFLETSAKMNENIENSFFEITRLVSSPRYD